MRKIRVAIADDHQLILDGLRDIIQKQTNFAFAFEALNGQTSMLLAVASFKSVTRYFVKIYM